MGKKVFYVYLNTSQSQGCDKGFYYILLFRNCMYVLLETNENSLHIDTYTYYMHNVISNKRNLNRADSFGKENILF